MKKPVIVVVAFNRSKSLKRLLDSIDNAIYPEDDVTLIISIDKGDDNSDVLDAANTYDWSYGTKKVVYQEENLKLRKHIIKCADYSQQYGAVIILEDDLLVSPYYYQYALEALSFSEDKDYIGGISLYNHCVNVNNSEPHYLMDDEYCNWYLQFASSWGEAWTQSQWKNFKEWYTEHENENLEGMDIPNFVTNWPDSSWLKYFIKYSIVKNKYYIYPKISLTTNFSDSGTHVTEDNPDFQVPLQYREMKYSFSSLEQSTCVYDAFFESQYLKKALEKDDLTVDLYGLKEHYSSKYVLTRRIMNNEIIQSYSCSMRPHEMNILLDIAGNDFFLYDMSVTKKNDIKFNGVRKIRYCIKYIRKEKYMDLLKYIFHEIINGIHKRMR